MITNDPNAKEISARACAILSVAISVFAMWMIRSTAEDGGKWYFSVLACFVPLMFAAQGFRKSREPGEPWAQFSRVVSIIGALMGVLALGGWLWLLSNSN